MNIDKIKQRTAEYFSARPEIKVGYLFGSQAKGEANVTSDTDIGILIEKNKVPKNVAYGYKAKIITELINLLKTEKVDLIILNESPLFLRFRIIREGIILCSKDEKRRVEFEVETMRRYFDRKFYYDRHVNLSLEAVSKDGIL